MSRLLQVCHIYDAQFDAQTSTTFDLCLRSLKNTYPLLIKTALSAFPLALQPGFLRVLEQAIKLFIAHPTTNSAILSLWSNTLELEQHNKQIRRNEALDGWLSATYPPFCDYCLSTSNNTDPDVVKHCYQVHLAVLVYQPSLFWGYNKFPNLY